MKKGRNKYNNIWQVITTIIIIAFVLISNHFTQDEGKIGNQNSVEENVTQSQNQIIDLSSIPEYKESPYVEINDNKPYFTEEEYKAEPFERYSNWDSLGRSGVAYANICKEIMPKSREKREDITSVKDLSGWIQKRYDSLIKDKYLYNRCHLIGWQLAGENANKQNLITGTRYLNTEGMLPFENLVADYIKGNNKNHVLYRVTPIYNGNNLLASGVEMEAWSVEDNGQGICFNIYCYNVQPGITINYETGESNIT